MKKISLLLIFLYSSFSFGQYLSEGFESGTFPPDNWVLIQNNTNETWEISSDAGEANNGINSANVTQDRDNQNETLTSHSIDLSSATNPRIKFWWNMSYSESIDPNDNYDFTVSIDNGTSEIELFNESDAGVFTDFTWYEQTLDLSDYIGLPNVKILFNYHGSEGNILRIDDILVDETPSCPAPTAITIGAITSTSADVTWTGGGYEDSWEYVIQAAGTGVPTGSGIDVPTGSGIGISNPLSLTELAASTDYEIYLRAVCASLSIGVGVGETSVEYSDWVSANFTTTINCDITDEALFHDFNTLDNNNQVVDAACWSVVNQSDPINTWVLSNNRWRLYYGNISSQHNDYLYSPAFTVINRVTDGFNFKGWSQSDDWIDLIDLLVVDATNNNLIGVLESDLSLPSLDTNTDANIFTYDLSAYEGQDIKIGFHSRTTGSWYANLDDFTLDAFSTLEGTATTWSGSTDSNWSNSTNWSNGVLPALTSDVTIPTGLTNYPKATSTVTVNSVVINSGASLIAESVFSGTVTYNRNLETTNWYLMSSPVVGETYDDAYVTANSIASGTDNPDNRAIATYTTNNDTWNYVQADASPETFTNGIGYAVKRTLSGDVSFTGDMNTNNDGVDIVLKTDGNRFNLLGNPYTSHIYSEVFLTSEDAISETNNLWVWNQGTGTSGAYEVKTVADAMVITPAQGFFVKANAAGGIFNFDKSNQFSTGGAFQRTEIRPEIYISVSNQTDAREAKIYYIENMTSGFDVGYEGELFNGVSNPLAIYTHLVADSEGKNYQVQSLPTNNYENMIIPVGINAVSGTAISIDASTNNFPEGINIYLEDKQDSSFTLLDADSSFSTTLENDLSGIGRFFLYTTSGTLSTDALEIHNNVSIYKTGNDNLRIVGVQNGTASIQIYNILGKQMMRTSFEGMGVNDISLPTLTNGVYIIKLATEIGTTNKKIIIK